MTDYEFEICKSFKKLILICKSIKNDILLDEKLSEINILINTGNHKAFIQKFIPEVITFSNEHIDLIVKEDEQILEKLNFPHSDLIRQNYHLVGQKKTAIWALIKEIIKL